MKVSPPEFPPLLETSWLLRASRQIPRWLSSSVDETVFRRFNQMIIRNNEAGPSFERPWQAFCDKCGTKMANFHNLMDHRIKMHGDKKTNFNDYKKMIRSGQHPFLPADSVIPIYM